MSLPPFQVFLDAHQGDLYRYLVAAVGVVDAGDCFQETMLAALRAYPQLQNGSNLSGWVFTIAHRKVVDAHRARERRPIPVEVVPERIDQAVPEGGDAIWERVRKLPPKQRTAVIHRFVGALSYAEIGTVIGCSETAARQNVHQGLEKLRREYVR